MDFLPALVGPALEHCTLVARPKGEQGVAVALQQLSELCPNLRELGLHPLLSDSTYVTSASQFSHLRKVHCQVGPDGAKMLDDLARCLPCATLEEFSLTTHRTLLATSQWDGLLRTIATWHELRVLCLHSHAETLRGREKDAYEISPLRALAHLRILAIRVPLLLHMHGLPLADAHLAAMAAAHPHLRALYLHRMPPRDWAPRRPLPPTLAALAALPHLEAERPPPPTLDAGAFAALAAFPHLEAAALDVRGALPAAPAPPLPARRGPPLTLHVAHNALAPEEVPPLAAYLARVCPRAVNARRDAPVDSVAAKHAARWAAVDRLLSRAYFRAVACGKKQYGAYASQSTGSLVLTAVVVRPE